MSENNFLGRSFEENRVRLRAVAYRMLGSLSEAEDAVQEAWLRLSAADGDIDNIAGWLSTVVARICLDMLRARKARREMPLETSGADKVRSSANPEEEAALADAVGLALLVVLQKLDPAERIAFVLHDMFSLPFEEIAPIVERTPEAARQLASRARRRVQGDPPDPGLQLSHHRQIVDAFLSASRDGDLQSLLAVLDPDVTFRADPTAARMGGPRFIRGAGDVAKTFSGRAQAARTALLGGQVGIVVAPMGRLLLVLEVTIVDGRITDIHAVADPDRLTAIDLSTVGAIR
jgi:RNA polymerase sigma-70 factor (ECF subfamily)